MTLARTENPTKLSEQDRRSLGIAKKLPASISEALEAATSDHNLSEALGREIYSHYLAMKKDEQEMLNQMSEKERRTWLMERY